MDHLPFIAGAYAFAGLSLGLLTWRSLTRLRRVLRNRGDVH